MAKLKNEVIILFAVLGIAALILLCVGIRKGVSPAVSPSVAEQPQLEVAAPTEPESRVETGCCGWLRIPDTDLCCFADNAVQDGDTLFIYDAVTDGRLAFLIDQYQAEEYALTHPTLLWETAEEQKEYAVCLMLHSENARDWMPLTDAPNEFAFDAALESLSEQTILRTDAVLQDELPLLILVTDEDAEHGRTVLIAAEQDLEVVEYVS